MASVSVADAKNNLSALIDRALAGEHVVITRHGHEVIEMRAVHNVPRANISREEIRRRRLARPAMTMSAAEMLDQIYDDR